MRNAQLKAVDWLQQPQHTSTQSHWASVHFKLIMLSKYWQAINANIACMWSIVHPIDRLKKREREGTGDWSSCQVETVSISSRYEKTVPKSDEDTGH